MVVTSASGSNPLEEAKAELNSLIGLASVKDQLLRFEAFLAIQKQRSAVGLPLNRQTLHFIFYGNPGTGKTTFAHSGRILRGYGILSRGHVVETDRASLSQSILGRRPLRWTPRSKKRLTESCSSMRHILLHVGSASVGFWKGGRGHASEAYGGFLVIALL